MADAAFLQPSIQGSADFLRAERRLVKQLNDDTVGIGAVERRAAVAV
jgi:hypothetical protein